VPGFDAGGVQNPRACGANSLEARGALLQELPDFLWVVFMGGTGTGKSTLFNALVGSSLSETGVERPKTGGPLVFSHKSIALESDFPFASMGIQRLLIDQLPPAAYSGNPDHLLVLAHSHDQFRHLVIVDTPDLDSVELKNRQTWKTFSSWRMWLFSWPARKSMPTRYPFVSSRASTWERNPISSF